MFDLTFANPNVYYELGVRQNEGRPSVLVACTGTPLAFNVQGQRVFYYDRENPDSWGQFQTQLRDAIRHSVATEEPKGPVPSRGEELTNVEPLPGWAVGAAERMRQQLGRATNAEQLVGIWYDWSSANRLAVDPLLELGRQFLDQNRLDLAVEVLAKAFEIAPDQYEIARTYGWYLSKSGNSEDAKKLLKKAIGLNDHDIESLGMLGGIYKRESRASNDEKQAKRLLSNARQQYDTAYQIDSESIYILVNLGALSAVDAEDNKDWQQYYDKVIRILRPRFERRTADSWDYLALAEAHLMLGDVSEALARYKSAVDAGATYPMLQSAVSQLEFIVDHGVQVTECREALQRVLYPSLGAEEPAPEVNPVSSKKPDAPNSLPVILQVSDLHFGQRRINSEKSVPMHRSGRACTTRLWRNTSPTKSRASISEGRDVQTIVLVASGDISNEAHQEDYADALEFFESICRDTGLPKEHVVLVPGNHDVNWTLIDHNHDERFDEYLKFLRRFYLEDSKGGILRKIYPYLSWDYDVDSPRPEPQDLLGIHHIEPLNLVLIAMNSCLHEDQERHYGVVGDDQLRRIQSHLESIGGNPILVAVLHHHVLPMDTSIWIDKSKTSEELWLDGSLVRDYGIVESQLQALGFDLVLHGHKHKPAFRETNLRTYEKHEGGRNSLYVCGCGSTGVSDKALYGTGNHFAVLRFRALSRRAGDPFVDLQWKEITNPHADWKELASWKIHG